MRKEKCIIVEPNQKKKSFNNSYKVRRNEGRLAKSGCEVRDLERERKDKFGRKKGDHEKINDLV